MNKKIEEVSNRCFVEMFHRVGINVANASEAMIWATDHGDNWYQKKSWSAEDEEDFKTWMITTIRRDLKATLKAAEAEAATFLLNYGWKTA